jgi:hypothetical protein
MLLFGSLCNGARIHRSIASASMLPVDQALTTMLQEARLVA